MTKRTGNLPEHRAHARSPGLERLRAATGAPAVRQAVVAEQDAVRQVAATQPDHTPVTSVIPFSVGCTVSDRRLRKLIRTGKVLHTHVHVEITPGVDVYGHVVHWAGNDVELVRPRDLTVLP